MYFYFAKGQGKEIRHMSQHIVLICFDRINIAWSSTLNQRNLVQCLIRVSSCSGHPIQIQMSHKRVEHKWCSHFLEFGEMMGRKIMDNNRQTIYSGRFWVATSRKSRESPVSCGKCVWNIASFKRGYPWLPPKTRMRMDKQPFEDVYLYY